MHGRRFAEAQESCCQSAKYSNIISDVIQAGRIADVQELRFHPAEHSDMSIAIVQGCHLLMLMNRVFRLPNTQV